jgi:AcrR family transcriptional regulator
MCTHPKREALNEAIALGTASMSQIAEQVGVNKSSVSRHFRRHLQPAMVAAGGGSTLAWDVKGKSRELTERMEALLSAITRDRTTGNDITKSELLESWQAVRAMGTEMREWMRLHGQATGELARDGLNTQTMSIQIVCPATGPPRVTFASADQIEAAAEPDEDDPGGLLEIGVLQPLG